MINGGLDWEEEKALPHTRAPVFATPTARKKKTEEETITWKTKTGQLEKDREKSERRRERKAD